MKININYTVLMLLFTNYFSHIIFSLQNMIFDNTFLLIQNIFYTEKTSRVTISPIIKVIYIPTRTELKLKCCDLWWSNDLYTTNKIDYVQTQERIMNKYPFLTVSQLKSRITEEYISN